jgi:hypothetical protein
MNTVRTQVGMLVGSMLAAYLVAAPAQAQMKAGLWESRVIRQTLNGEDMSAKMADGQKRMQEAMAKMSPEQRKQMEQMMGKQGVQMGAPGAARFCVSAAMAARQEPLPDPDKQCKNKSSCVAAARWSSSSSAPGPTGRCAARGAPAFRAIPRAPR